jgi:hypothetical protein
VDGLLLSGRDRNPTGRIWPESVAHARARLASSAGRSIIGRLLDAVVLS